MRKKTKDGKDNGGDKRETRPDAPIARRADLGELLIRQQFVSIEQLDEAKRAVAESGGSLRRVLNDLGLVSEYNVVKMMSEVFGVPSLDNLDGIEIPAEVLKMVPKKLALKHKIIPVAKTGDTLTLAMSDPSDLYAMDDIKILTHFKVEAVVTSEQAIETALKGFYGEDTLTDILEDFTDEEIQVLQSEETVDAKALEQFSKDANIIRLVNLILVDAVRKGASDVHLESFEKHFRVRYRIDGVLVEVMQPEQKISKAVVARIKIMSELDIAEKRLPQDGRIKLVLGKNKEVDFRVSVLPCLHGENVVLRILDKSALQVDMSKLGFEPDQLAAFHDAVKRPWGMVLVTGPTGSGKTTTLYSALVKLNLITDKILTAEDPVEMSIDGINQVHINDGIGLTFAAALRSFLRQDPDVIMVGEIRDFETAEIAVKAALTGHLVLSTLHTNDAPSTINRLLNMGIEPFLVTSSINLIAAQRLTRKICTACKVPQIVPPQALIDLGISAEQAAEAKLFHGEGCKACNNTGYRGRIGLFEIMPLSDELGECVIQGYSAMELRREAKRLGMRTMREVGIAKMLAGIITLEELLRVTM